MSLDHCGYSSLTRTKVNWNGQSGDDWLGHDDSIVDRQTGRDLANWTVASKMDHVRKTGRQKRRPISRANSDESGDIRKSAYVCEDGALELSCNAGKHIDVLRANFGRFSIALCNPSGFLDWSVNCASGNSLPVLTERFVSLWLYLFYKHHLLLLHLTLFIFTVK